MKYNRSLYNALRKPLDPAVAKRLTQAFKALSQDKEYLAEIKLWDVCVGDGLNKST